MAELKCSDGTVIQISDETEAELREAFGPKPSYFDRVVKVSIGNSVEAYIVALQEAVKYCKQHNLGV